MNWLAHVFLSESSPEFRLGNLLPDLLEKNRLIDFGPEVQRGIECHRRIDAFTDSHEIVLQSIRRVNVRYRRFAGIVVDVFYDHFLATDWQYYSATPLEEFARDVYASFEKVYGLAPQDVVSCLQRMKQGDLFCSYRSTAGVEMALERIGRRFRKPVDLGSAASDLQARYDSLHADFTVFFPELRAHAGYCSA
jgi:acyl carrier protein phosphodiesterase